MTLILRHENTMKESELKMIPDGIDPVIIFKLTSQQVEQVTCVECCQYYIAPETASCGHTLCHGCWSGRRSCPSCASPLDRRALKLNIPLQLLTEHIHALGDAFEKFFSIKLDEFVLDLPENNMECENDPSKNVKEWLASSQNHFSAPVLSSQHSTQDLAQSVELSSSKIQIHISDEKMENQIKVVDDKKSKSPAKLIIAPQPQEDWDKIETLPDTEDIGIKNKENIIGPMDTEPFFIDDEYTSENPRRSSRKKEMKNDSEPYDIPTEKQCSKNSSNEPVKRIIKAKQNWSNVKKMSKEFNKLNKQNKNKLNVSIEMCKKTQSIAAQPKSVSPLAGSQKACYAIDDNTPNLMNRESEKNSKKSFEESLLMCDDKNQHSNNNNKCVMENHKAISFHKEIVTDIQSKEISNKLSLKNQQTETLTNKESNKSLTNIDFNINKPSRINESSTSHVPMFKRSVLHQKQTEKDCIRITQNDIGPNTGPSNADDIEISIKVGSTVTNIVIKQKQNDVQLKLNVDREIQTSLGPFGLSDKRDASCSPIRNSDVQNVKVVMENNCKNSTNKIKSASRTVSTKKNTDSADTATANFEITESVEKELSDLMECVETDNIKNKSIGQNPNTKETLTEKGNEVLEDVDYLRDLDIFNSGSVKDLTDVHFLKNTEPAPSDILISTLKNKKSQKVSDKRDRDTIDEAELPCNKKQKLNSDKIIEIPLQHVKKSNVLENSSEIMNYDTIMSQVFANIDADMKDHDALNSKKGKRDTSVKITQTLFKTQGSQKPKGNSAEVVNTTNSKEFINQKYSENMFSLLEKDSEPRELQNQHENPEPTQQHIDNLLTPGMCRVLASSTCEDQTLGNDVEMMEPFGTPVVDHEDSDRSVVEETPQKNSSFTKLKQIGDMSIKNNDISDKNQVQKTNSSNEKYIESQIIKSIINITDTPEDSNKNTTIVEISDRKQTLETPLTINKFVDRIKHNSTPMARKSLNFESENIEDPEQTLCPTTTQEKEFLANAFEKTPVSPIKKPLSLRNVKVKENKVFCLAGSCLTSAELTNVKKLCRMRGWAYVDKYTKDLTHLVVGVDEENKSQRSVKYMCALAASKWIVTYSWVDKCLQMRNVDELPYEALDASGEPGPRRSRIAQRKLFDGFTFYCMSPFSVLSVETLKHMLEAAGGHVVNTPHEVKVTFEGNQAPSLLLAEPEHTQEDRFTYLAMELSIVPVNYEWVLNCLGNYVLSSLHDLLLCSPSLLPEATKEWPETLLTREMDDSDIQ